MYKPVLPALVLLYATTAAAAIPSSQRDALIAIYDATDGPIWNNRTGWKDPAGTECSWFGVRCNAAETSVVELDLSSNNLRGALPPAIGNFPDLETLLLFDDHLTGTLPATIGQLTKLETLYAHRNELSGVIPSSVGTMRSLRRLGLDGNKIGGPLPIELGNAIALEQVGLSYNEIAGELPHQLGQLINLTDFDASVNRLTGTIPKELGALTKLVHLGLVDNQLEGSIPTELGSLTALQSLRLSYNKLTGTIPTTLGALRDLDQLDLGVNQLTGNLPREILLLPKLRILNVVTNRLDGTLPPELFRQTTLEELYLSDNRFGGTIPTEVGALTNLQVLSLYGNQFVGTIPPQIGSLSALRSLELQNNQLEGRIPVEIGNLKNLTWMDLAQNKLSGQIPSVLGSLSKLEVLSLYENQLDGTIPTELGNLSELGLLHLTSNRLTGTIPDSLRNLKKLVNFYLGGNQLNGSIPDWIGDLSELSTIYFPGNQFTGVIPPSIGRLTKLASFYLGSNPLSGTIPKEIGNLRELGYLSLENTDIGGPIPPEFWTLTNLVEIRLNDMALTGTLPAEIGNLRKADVFLLSHNRLEGSIPPEIANLPRVLYLGLSGNRFTGTIPAQIGQMTQLLGIGLASNALRGPVPAAIRNLTNLADGGSDFTFNAILENDPATRDFLGRKQWEPDFHRYQTIPPTNVRVTLASDRHVTMEWDLIPFRDYEGGYQVTASTSPGGSPVVVATTASKQIGTISVRGLQPSTTYYFTVAAVTHPHDYQENLLTSDPAPAVTATTAARVIVPADVVVAEQPTGLVQINGVPRNEDSFTLTNFGDAPTNITFAKEGTFFTIAPDTFALSGGASQTVTIRSITQSPGTYYGYVQAQGAGAGGEDDIVYITLLSAAPPSGTVIAEPVTTRVEVVGDAGTDSVGSARYRSAGTARLSGIVLSDQPWLVPNPEPITIEPGSIGTVNFRILRSRRPPGVDGALTGNLSLVYVDGSSGNALASLTTRLSAYKNGDSATTLETPTTGISITLVTVVDTTKPPTQQSQLPGFGAGEVALFASGLASFTRSNNRFVSDLSLANVSGSRSITDLRLYFTPPNATQATVATLSNLGSSQSVSLANVVTNVYGRETGVGSLQIRSASWQSVAAQAKLVNVKSNGTYTGDVPLFRSDRSVSGGQPLYLTGVRKSSSQHTDLYLQETGGSTVSARIEMLDAAGNAAGSPQSVTMTAFGMSEMLDAIPTEAATVVVTAEAGSGGRLAAYARVTDDESGDTWSIVDWSRAQRFALTEAVRVPFIDGVSGTTNRKRRAVGHGTAAPIVTGRATTELTLFNPTTSEVRAKVTVFDATGRSYEREVTVAPRRTIVLSDLGATASSAVAHALVTPAARSQLVLTARSLRSASGTFGAAVPVVPEASGLRLGQTQRFSSLDDSTARTVAAGTAGTFRTSFGLLETSGQPVTVRASMLLDFGRSLVTAVISKEFKLAPGQQIVVSDLVKSIVGESRETELGELHNLTLQLDVTEGRGSVVPFVIVTDNGSGDSIVRLE